MPSFGTIKADTLTHSTAGSLATNFVVNGSLKGFAFYHQSLDTTGSTLNIASITDSATGIVHLNLTNNVNTEDEPHTGSGVGSANTTVVGYEAGSDSTTSSRRYNTTNSASSDALSDSGSYTLIGGELA